MKKFILNPLFYLILLSKITLSLKACEASSFDREQDGGHKKLEEVSSMIRPHLVHIFPGESVCNICLARKEHPIHLDPNELFIEYKTYLQKSDEEAFFQIKKLLFYHPQFIHYQDSEGRSALHLASLKLKTKVVEHLLRLNIDKTKKDNFSRTAQDYLEDYSACFESKHHKPSPEEIEKVKKVLGLLKTTFHPHIIPCLLSY